MDKMQKLKEAYPEQITSLPMFHVITKTTAEYIVHQYSNGPGTYLLRPSSTGDKNFLTITLSITGRQDVGHIRVMIEYGQGRDEGKYIFYLNHHRKFSSIIDFLRYYSKNLIDCPDDNINVMLLRGLGCNSSVSKPRPSLIKQRSEGDDARSPGKNEKRRLSIGSAQSPTSPELNTVYSNHSVISDNFKEDIRHRSALPLPKRSCSPSSDPTYTPTYFEVDPNRDFFHDTYVALKEAEMCECGLRVVDSTLPCGWTVHKMEPDDCSSNGKIFFQAGEDITRWDLPSDVLDLLSEVQFEFIVSVCEMVNCAIPHWLKNRNTNMAVQLPSNEKKSGKSKPSSLSLASVTKSTNSGRGITPSMTSANNEDENAYEQPSPLFLNSPNGTGFPQQPSSIKMTATASGPSATSSVDNQFGTVHNGSFHRQYDVESDEEDTYVSEGSLPHNRLETSDKTFENQPRRTSFKSTPAVKVPTVAGAPSSTTKF